MIFKTENKQGGLKRIIFTNDDDILYLTLFKDSLGIRLYQKNHFYRFSLDKEALGILSDLLKEKED